MADLPIKNGDFPSLFVCLPEGTGPISVAGIHLGARTRGTLKSDGWDWDWDWQRWRSERLGLINLPHGLQAENEKISI